jgi:hypothetical protein
MEPDVHAEDNGRAMLLGTGIAAVSIVICILASTSLYGADRPITVGVVIDGSNQQDKAPLQAYLAKSMPRPVMIASPDNYGATVAALADGSFMQLRSMWKQLLLQFPDQPPGRPYAQANS